MRDYEERYVAFIDILGFKELIRRSETDPSILERLLRILERVNEIANLKTSAKSRGAEKDGESSFQFSTFSDSVLLSTRKSRDGAVRIVAMTSLICTQLIQEGILCRGAISSGKLIHTDKVVLGQGLIHAYQLESGAAIYPRIVLDDSIVEVLPVSSKLVRRDFDGVCHLHIFDKGLLKHTNQVLNELNPDIEEDYFAATRSEIDHSIRNAPNLAIKAKVTWLVQYFNEYAADLEMEPISIDS